MIYAASLIIYTAVAMVIHELGHIGAARACAVTASELSLGLGPKLGGFRLASIQFNIRFLPFGSFVRLNVTELRSKPARQQLFVHLAGVAINFIFALATYGTLFGWINLLLAAGNLLPLYQHDGWKCGLVVMRTLLGRKSLPVEWTFTFCGCYISLFLINLLVHCFI